MLTKLYDEVRHRHRPSSFVNLPSEELNELTQSNFSFRFSFEQFLIPFMMRSARVRLVLFRFAAALRAKLPVKCGIHGERATGARNARKFTLLYGAASARGLA
jgi:hypothetical protein